MVRISISNYAGITKCKGNLAQKYKCVKSSKNKATVVEVKKSSTKSLASSQNILATYFDGFEPNQDLKTNAT